MKIFIPGLDCCGFHSSASSKSGGGTGFPVRRWTGRLGFFGAGGGSLCSWRILFRMSRSEDELGGSVNSEKSQMPSNRVREVDESGRTERTVRLMVGSESGRAMRSLKSGFGRSSEIFLALSMGVGWVWGCYRSIL